MLASVIITAVRAHCTLHTVPAGADGRADDLSISRSRGFSGSSSSHRLVLLRTARHRPTEPV